MLFCRIKNTKWQPHGQTVVAFYMEQEGGLLGFEKMWRKQFVEYMQPKFLPPLWSVEHKPERMKPLDMALAESYRTSEEDEYD